MAKKPGEPRFLQIPESLKESINLSLKQSVVLGTNNIKIAWEYPGTLGLMAQKLWDWGLAISSFKSHSDT